MFCLNAGKKSVRCKYYILIFITVLVTALLSSCSLFSAPNTQKTEKNTLKHKTGTVKKTDKKSDTLKKREVVFELDFEKASKSGIDARAWLKKNGFEMKSAADNQDKLNISFRNNALFLQSEAGIFSFMIKKHKIEKAKYIRVTWGIDQFPKGASYKQGVNNEALMIYTYFGNKKLSSNSFFIPDSPYFIGVFLGKDEDLKKPYTGKHFKEGGRFVCVGMPKENETVTSEYNLEKGFKECFGKNAPYVSALAIETETSGSGAAKAFIKKIEYLN